MKKLLSWIMAAFMVMSTVLYTPTFAYAEGTTETEISSEMAEESITEEMTTGEEIPPETTTAVSEATTAETTQTPVPEETTAVPAETTAASAETTAAPMDEEAVPAMVDAAAAPAVYALPGVSTMALTPVPQKQYIGYKEESGYCFVNPLYVDDDGGKVIAYCYNGARRWPTPKSNQSSNIFFKVENANAEDMNYYSQMNSTTMRDDVLRTVYNGYPYNAGMIQNVYRLTDMEFRAVTQAAIWWFTDREPLFNQYNSAGQVTKYGSSFNLTHRTVIENGQYISKQVYHWDERMTAAYNELVQNTNGLLKGCPADFELDLFLSATNLEALAEGDKTQNLLSTKLPVRTEQEYISIPVTKIWDTRGGLINVAGVSVILKANDNVLKTAELNPGNGWAYVFADLPKYDDNGYIIDYSVEETRVDGYTTNISGDQNEGYEIVNTADNVTFWYAKRDENGAVVNGATIRVYSDMDGTPDDMDVWDEWVSTADACGVELEPGTYWLVEVDVPEGYQQADPIQFTVGDDDSITVHTANVAGTGTAGDPVIMVDKTQEKVSFKVNKKWVDDDDRDKVRPETVTVELYAEGNDVPVRTAELSERVNWEAEWIGLDKYSNDGTEYVYTVKEKAVDQYTSAVELKDGTFIITNTHEAGKTSLEGRKIWDDNEDQDKIRPEKLTIVLMADGADIQEQEINENGGWKYSFSNLPVKKDGRDIVYTVREKDVPEGYTATVEGNDIRNTHETENTEITVEKKWNDDNDRDGVRPESVTVRLLADGQDTGMFVELNEDNNWTGSFKDLEAKAAGQKIVYTIVEDAVEGYAADIRLKAGTDAVAYEIINTHENEVVDIAGVKTWNDRDNLEGKRPDKITVNLLADGQIVRTAEASKDGRWEYSFAGLPKYEGGTEIRYTVDEVPVPGYVAEVNGFDITNNETDGKVIFYKYDADNAPLAEAEVRVTGENDTTVLAWTTDGRGKTLELAPGRYVFEELRAPSGYELADPVVFIVNNDLTISTEDGEPLDNVTLIDEFSDQTVEISKTDIGGNEIDGAKLTITDKDGKVVDEWESTSEETHKSVLKPGTYTLTEVTAPKGYEVAESVTFSVDKDGVVKVEGEDADKVVMVDEYSDQTVEISKTDIGGNEIDGAKLTVTDENGNVVDEWESTSEETHKSVLKPGTYTLTEVTAPKGYEVAESVTFSVDKDGAVKVEGEDADKVVMVDEFSDQIVEISKTDIGGNEIDGAKLTITDKDGNVVDEWESTSEETHKSVLKPGTYTLTEVTAPKGYEVAESVTFSVDKDGVVKVEGEDADKVVMVDEYSDQTVEISKTDIGGNEIDGAKLTITDKDGKVVDEWESTSEETHKSVLKPGTYTLTEVTAPKGYEVAESVTFSVDKDGVVKVEGEDADKVVMVDEYSDQIVEISKTDIGGNEIDGAKLTITDKDGKVVDEWESTSKETHKSSLKPGTYTLTEVTAPKGYEVAESVTFSVDKDGVVKVEGEDADKVVMVDEYSDQIVEISKTDIGGNEIDGAKLTITDKDGKVVDEWESTSKETHKSSLKPGTYTLTEITAPNGYEVAESIVFSVNKDGVVTVNNTAVDKVVMVDQYSRHIVEISKTDVGGREIAGAQLTITDAKNNVADSWISVENQSHKTSLKPGTYTLTEVLAPKGYKKASSITFTVDINGKVTVGGKEVSKVVMIDELEQGVDKILGIEDHSTLFGIMFISFGAAAMMFASFVLIRRKNRK